MVTTKERRVKNLECVHRHRRKNRTKVRESARRSMRKWTLWYRFHLTLEDYDKMLKRQKGRCAICGCKQQGDDMFRKGKALAVDHDHITGKNRGLLCDLCNRGLGQFQDSTKILKAALKYLIKNRRRREKNPGSVIVIGSTSALRSSKI